METKTWLINWLNWTKLRLLIIADSGIELGCRMKRRSWTHSLSSLISRSTGRAGRDVAISFTVCLDDSFDSWRVKSFVVSITGGDGTFHRWSTLVSMTVRSAVKEDDHDKSDWIPGRRHRDPTVDWRSTRLKRSVRERMKDSYGWIHPFNKLFRLHV